MSNVIKRYLVKRLPILAWLALIGLIIGEFGRVFWFFELFSHFMPYYVLLLLLGMWAAPIRWQKITFLFAILFFLVKLYIPLLPHYWQQNNDAVNRPEATKFLAYNLYINNKTLRHDLAWLVQQDADVIFLTEATQAVEGALNALKEQYPYGCQRLENSPFGLALYARKPLQSCDINTSGVFAAYPYIRAQLDDGRMVYGVHPPPPILSSLALERNQFLEELSVLIRNEQKDVLLMGDMNITPFSPHYQQFIQTAGLMPALSYWRPTWMPGMLPLDHVLIKSSYSAEAKGYGRWLGSDHRAVWVVW